MAYTAEEGYVQAGTMRIQEIGKPRVLVVAHPDLAVAIYEALDLDEPPNKRDSASRPTQHQVTPNSVSQLCRETFPIGRQEKPNSRSKVSGVFKSGLMKVLSLVRQVLKGNSTTPPESENSTISLFEWGDYDFIIIQDLWANRLRSTRPTLETAGYELAHLDYYELGNFNTKKIILVTDHEFPRIKWERESGERSEGFDQIVRTVFDEKDALTLVQLSRRDALEQLRDFVFGRPNVGNAEKVSAVTSSVQESANTWVDRASLPATALRDRVKREIREALRLYIQNRAEVILIEDELKELALTYSEVTGAKLTEATSQGVIKDAVGTHHDTCVLLASSSENTISAARNLEHLVELCEEKFNRAVEGGKTYVLFVTDILFKLPSWDKTGIDLIEELRRRLKLRGEGRFGIVAFTGFSTPFIAMSSYQRGADFVVPKNSGERHDASTTGTERLLMTLAALCFQKSFLRDKRREAALYSDVKSATGQSSEGFARSLRHLHAVLPRHAVSFYLQQEWLDTCYLLDALTIYEPGSLQRELVFREVIEKYA
jgi:hypothetical protein